MGTNNKPLNEQDLERYGVWVKSCPDDLPVPNEFNSKDTNLPEESRFFDNAEKVVDLDDMDLEDINLSEESGFSDNAEDVVDLDDMDLDDMDLEDINLPEESGFSDNAEDVVDLDDMDLDDIDLDDINLPAESGFSDNAEDVVNLDDMNLDDMNLDDIDLDDINLPEESGSSDSSEDVVNLDDMDLEDIDLDDINLPAESGFFDNVENVVTLDDMDLDDMDLDETSPPAESEFLDNSEEMVNLEDMDDVNNQKVSTPSNFDDTSDISTTDTLIEDVPVIDHDNKISDGFDSDDKFTRLFQKFEKEVNDLRREICQIKDEITNIATPKMQIVQNDEEQAMGFFDENENDTIIALTDDEFDNILASNLMNGESTESTKVYGSASDDMDEGDDVIDLTGDENIFNDNFEGEDADINNESAILIQEDPSESYLDGDSDTIEIDLSFGDDNIENIDAQESGIESIVDTTEFNDISSDKHSTEDLTSPSLENNAETSIDYNDSSNDDMVFKDVENIELDSIMQYTSSGNIDTEEINLPQGNTIKGVEGIQPDRLEDDIKPRENLELQEIDNKNNKVIEESKDMDPSDENKIAAVHASLSHEKVREVLKYMDELLEFLPNKKFHEFARSEQFGVYNQMLEEMGISDK